ncbi:unnamed protein product [Gordionus sp. m RMFG-2023]
MRMLLIGGKAMDPTWGAPESHTISASELTKELKIDLSSTPRFLKITKRRFKGYQSTTLGIAILQRLRWLTGCGNIWRSSLSLFSLCLGVITGLISLSGICEDRNRACGMLSNMSRTFLDSLDDYRGSDSIIVDLAIELGREQQFQDKVFKQEHFWDYDSFQFGQDLENMHKPQKKFIPEDFFMPDCRLCPNSAALPNAICGVRGGINCPDNYFCDLRPTTKMVQDRYGCCCPFPTTPAVEIKTNISTTTTTALTFTPVTSTSTERSSIVTVMIIGLGVEPCSYPGTQVPGCDPCSNIIECSDGSTSGVICFIRNCNYICEGIFINRANDDIICIQFML